LFFDLQTGIFERFHSMPIARSSVLWGHVLTSLVDRPGLVHGHPDRGPCGRDDRLPS
jgi:hypothetical protein